MVLHVSGNYIDIKFLPTLLKYSMNSVKTKFNLKEMVIPTAVKDKKGRFYWHKETQNPDKYSNYLIDTPISLNFNSKCFC